MGQNYYDKLVRSILADITPAGLDYAGPNPFLKPRTPPPPAARRHIRPPHIGANHNGTVHITINCSHAPAKQ